MKRLFTFLFTFILLIAVNNRAMAQDMAFEMRNNGKIYVVVFVLATIFAGIFAFLVYIEKRLKKLESNK
jgi:uncharacterized membrane protein (DUF485 family)